MATKRKLEKKEEMDDQSPCKKSSKEEKAIEFYEEKGEWFEFSNFYGTKQLKSFKLNIEGHSYPTTEHYYQAMKFDTENPSEAHLEFMEAIRNSKTANIARILALQKSGGGYKWRTDLNPIIQKSKDDGVAIRTDWEQIKETVMKKALFGKFKQNPSLKKLRLSTGDSEIVEASPRDSYWGKGKDSKGQNRLGVLLMELREELREEK